jgi:hypothetical protein
MSQSLSPEARQLLSGINSGRRTRWRVEELQAKHLEVLPHMRGRPEGRRELGELVRELADAGHLRPSVSEDRSRIPVLPAFVDVVRFRQSGNGRDAARKHGWRPELAQALALEPAPTPAELRILRKVNRWLADRAPYARPSGSRERSLEIFGDEKLLDERLRYGRLFAIGLLSYELLGARRIAPGLITEVVGTEPTVLVVENTDTFRSVADALIESGQTQVGLVAWGAGAAFEQSCEALTSLQVGGEAVRRAWYFGDIDPSGLRIPAHAAQLLAPLALEPARPLYANLLDLDQRGTARERVTEATDQHLEWLGEPLASRARSVMSANARLAQEALTAEVLQSVNTSFV